ncbi:DODA-type extradiol aromatic ring-opening family dioxygenase [Clostridium saccharobutylicum]|uniref:Extradiol ring-cleavage dioxygenase class III protein subunit B n=1 Tax=Clostridium saccharobutylicum DSM 13864 TaxID=1345695 RepID=U5MUI4_CLOSA|nr:class III extradiol ring-cleavage dioxygenase [Clostridium saccharobutylicum]AGX43102.1 extradiol ring-cleavage dioxygenase class III protein subunit B [Clostridium saccharobutylicum DSM 13864]AQR90399.1 LigB family dioxygenase [Clostridium saccharobutylicum]AQS00305.1 LigB family dioxygenase [Clostridium saccharobutylicum]AQS14288.1 LigB family dioxygenase [Clostridium saccharobutylicum]MBC2403334.1 dioxygenase [Clostridium saccharobutylicum]
MISSVSLCHGGPTLIVEKNEYTDFLKDLGKKLAPKAIVIFTAHWESEITTISAIDDTYDMMYDFYGFPKELYSVKYPAKCSVEVASKLQSMLRSNGIESKLDENRGLDHGAWDVLYLMYPKANLPIVQVSVNPEIAMEKQYEIGRAIRDLGKEDILVIGSGSTVHNLSTVDWNSDKAEEWAVEFDNWLIESMENNDTETLFRYKQLAPNAKRAVPRQEHIVPMFIAMGSGNKDKAKLLHQGYAYGTLSYICFEF